MAAMSTLPMVLEAACRTRVVTPEVLEDYRRSWGGVTSVVIIDPAILPQRSEILELKRAIPEVEKIQPRSVYRLMISSKKSLLKEFAKSVGGVIGAAPESDLRGFGELRPVLERERPILFEPLQDRGLCCVCGKRGALKIGRAHV